MQALCLPLFQGSFAYVPQHAWCQNCSIRDNILFGKRMCRARYEYILDACALRSDLGALHAGDETDVKENVIPFFLFSQLAVLAILIRRLWTLCL